MSGSSSPVRVAVAGLGRLGHELVRAAEAAAYAEPVAVVTSRGPGAAAELPQALPVLALDRALANTGIDVVLHGGAGTAQSVRSLFEQCASAGKGVVTSAALVNPWADLGRTEAGRLDQLARSNGVHLLSTGLNPGLLLDALPALCATLAPGWRSLSAVRTVEASAWGPAILDELGIGRPVEEFGGRPAISLVPSLLLVSDMLGVRLAGDPEEARRPGGDASGGGEVVEFEQVSRATTVDGRAIELRWFVAMGLRRRHPDRSPGVTISADDGSEPLRLEMGGGFSADPYPATAGRMVAAAAAMRAVEPGLLTVADVPWFPTRHLTPSPEEGAR